MDAATGELPDGGGYPPGEVWRGIPVWLPGLFSMLTTLISGLTSFGDAIFYNILWAMATAAGVVPPGRESLQNAVTCITLQSVVTLPLFVWFARRELCKSFAYGAAMATSGISMVPVGSLMLFFGDLTAVNILTGAFFLIFSVGRLTADAMGVARAKLEELQAAPSGSADSTPSATSSEAASGDSSGGSGGSGSGGLAALDSVQAGDWSHEALPIGGAPAPPASAAGADKDKRDEPFPSLALEAVLPVPVASALSAASATAAAQGRSRCPACLSRLLGRLPPLTPRYSPGRALMMLFTAGIGSGFLGGMLGTGGPPQMIAFSLLGLHKDAIRSVSVSYSILELPMRVAMFTSASGNVFNPHQQAGMYAGVALGALVGFSAGTFLRRYASSEAIVRLLLCLVFASSSMLLGALTSVAVAVTFVALALGVGGFLGAMVLAPERFELLLKWRRKAKGKAAPAA